MKNMELVRVLMYAAIYCVAVYAAASVTAPAAATNFRLQGTVRGPVVCHSSDVATLDGVVYIADSFTAHAGCIVAAEPGASLVIPRDATIDVRGTKTRPVLFTTVLEINGTLQEYADTRNVSQVQGLWDGVFILGNGMVEGRTEQYLPGFPVSEQTCYGGSNNTDSSGSIQFLEIRHAGAVQDDGNVTSGLTLAGVGSGTSIDFVSVIFSAGNGITIAGGGVPLRHVKSIFNADAQIHVSEGYFGAFQFVFTALGLNGQHGLVVRGSNDASDPGPRTFVMMHNAHMIGYVGRETTYPSEEYNTSLIVLTGGAGGFIGNTVIENVGKHGIENTDCSLSQVRFQTSNVPATANWYNPDNAVAEVPNYLFVSPKTVIHSPLSGYTGTDAIYTDSSCTSVNDGTLDTATTTDPTLVMMPPFFEYDNTSSKMVAPQPMPNSPLLTDHDASPGGPWWTPAPYKGAFGAVDDNWLSDWTWLHANARLPDGDIHPTIVVGTTSITTDTTWSGDVMVAGAVTVKSEAELTIEPGTKVHFLREDTEGNPVHMIIASGSTINATGTADNLITFKSALPQAHLPARGMWGGLVIASDAPVADNTQTFIDFGASVSYGGINGAANSGVLQHVQILHAGDKTGEVEKFGALNLCGVGDATTIDMIAVEYSDTNGLHVRGGTARIGHVAVIESKGDGMVFGTGYAGEVQHGFVQMGAASGHAMVLHGTGSATPQTKPDIANVEVVGHIASSDPSVWPPTTDDTTQPALVVIKDGAGGSLRNLLITNVADHATAVQEKNCMSGTVNNRGQTVGDFLYVSKKTRIYRPGNPGSHTKDYHFGTTPDAGYVACTAWLTTEAKTADPELILVHTNINENTPFIDPRPHAGSPAYTEYDTISAGTFMEAADYAGTFAPNGSLWVAGVSTLAESGRCPGEDTYGASVAGHFIDTDITTDTTLSTGEKYYVGTNVAVTSDATLTVEPGAELNFYPISTDGTRSAPGLIVAADATIVADGTADQPIVFKSVASSRAPPHSVSYGQITVLGNGSSPASAGGGFWTRSSDNATFPFGGGDNTATDNNRMSFVQIRDAGMAHDNTLLNEWEFNHDRLAFANVSNDTACMDRTVVEERNMSYMQQQLFLDGQNESCVFAGYDESTATEPLPNFNTMHSLGIVTQGKGGSYGTISVTHGGGLTVYGGAPDVKHVVSAYHRGRDCLTATMGSTSRFQYVVLIPGQDGKSGLRSDGSLLGSTTTPQVYNLAIVGAQGNTAPHIVITNRSGLELGNTILVNVYGVGIEHTRCWTATVTQSDALFNHSDYFDTTGDAVASPDFVHVSQNIIMDIAPGATPFHEDGCHGLLDYRDEDPMLQKVPRVPEPGKAMNLTAWRYNDSNNNLAPTNTNYDTEPEDDFFNATEYLGAVADGNNWILQWMFPGQVWAQVSNTVPPPPPPPPLAQQSHASDSVNLVTSSAQMAQTEHVPLNASLHTADADHGTAAGSFPSAFVVLVAVVAAVGLVSVAGYYGHRRKHEGHVGQFAGRYSSYGAIADTDEYTDV